MRLFGFDLTRVQKATPPLMPVSSDRRGWYPLIVHEPYTGAWQRNDEAAVDSVLAYFAVYACITLIAGDLAKMPLDLAEKGDDGIYRTIESAAFSPVLRTPNRYQNRLQFIQWWITSKLAHGNAYALKARDGRGIVTALYLLDPARVTVLVAPDGSVFYELKTDNLAGLTTERVIVPAREIIHDRMNPLFHPLVGISPLYAAQLAAQQGLRIQTNSVEFFENASMPGGVLTAPGLIPQDQVDQAKADWEAQFGGPQAAGKIAVLSHGLKYEPMHQTAVDSQLFDQWRFTVDAVCSCFHVDPWMIGIGPLPSFNNVEAMQQVYRSKCLDVQMKSVQACLADGLELPRAYSVHFDLDDLLLMDTATKMSVAKEGVNAAVLTPNEARQKFNLPPKEGGDSPYLQQQYYSLEALNRRDTEQPPPATPAPALPPELSEEDVTEKAMRLVQTVWRAA
jgi:HK97 family phage portal protein